MDRRQFLHASAAAGLMATNSAACSSVSTGVVGAIDRAKVVGRHNPEFTTFRPVHALTVGNGEFAFTSDITGLQTFASECEQEFPLCTAAHWGWHTSPRPAKLQGEALRLRMYDTHGLAVPYATERGGQEALFDYLRMNEHKFHLGPGLV